MCLDKAWTEWFQAVMSNTEPKVTEVGIAYMLQGSSEASNADPSATLPLTSDKWLISAPHIMVLMPGKWNQKLFSTEHSSTTGPWIMFPGTPVEHLMVPVTDKVAAK
jgi:hypothetical protein